MKTLKLILIMLFVCLITSNTFSQLVFLNRYSGNGNGNNVSTAIAVDGSGNTYVTGFVTNLLTGEDITTLKYDPNGSLIWSASYNGSANGNDEAYAITLDAAGNVYIAGTSVNTGTGNDFTVIKYDNGGQQQWVRSLSTPGSDVAYAITVDALGNPIATGFVSDPVLGNQLAVVKYDTSGVQQWAQIGGAGLGTSVVYAITVDGSNNIIVTGSSKLLVNTPNQNKNILAMKLSSSGAQQWQNTYSGSGAGDNEGYSIACDNNNNVFLTGYTTTQNNGKDYVTISYNTSGSQNWLSSYNGIANSDDIPNRLIVDDNGDVVVTGSSKHSNAPDCEDYLTLKYSGSDGSQQFEARYNDPNINGKSISYGVSQYKHSRYYVTGYSRQSNLPGSEDIVTIEYTAKGQMKSKYLISNPGCDCAYDIRADHNGNFMLAGYLSNSSSHDTYNGPNSMCSAKYSSSGNSANNVIALTELETGIPKNFSLHQNYPNPFNPSTVINFDVSHSSLVKIVIYDILGREVLTPVNDYLNPGSYAVSVSLNMLSSGLYFYRMTAGSFTDTKKMMLTK